MVLSIRPLCTPTYIISSVASLPSYTYYYIQNPVNLITPLRRIMMTLPYRYPLFRSSGRTHARKYNHFGYQSDRGNRIISSSRTFNPHTPTRYFHHFIAGLDGIGAISCALHRRSWASETRVGGVECENVLRLRYNIYISGNDAEILERYYIYI